MVDNNQNGKLIVTAEEFENDPDLVASLLGRIGFFPYAVHFIDEIESFVMIGFSRRFKPLKMGDEAPLYKLIIHDDNPDGEVKVIHNDYLSLPEKGEKPEDFHKRAAEKINNAKSKELFDKLNTDISH